MAVAITVGAVTLAYYLLRWIRRELGEKAAHAVETLIAFFEIIDTAFGFAGA